MSIKHHINEETLLAYAAGDLDDAFSLVVAAHLSLCPTCRRTVAIAEDVGGALIEDLAPMAMSDGAARRVMSSLDFVVRDVPAPRPAAYSGQPVLPAPLRARFGGDVDTIRWRRIAPGVQQVRLNGGDGRTSVRLLRIAGGASVPEHGHLGEEMTLVLAGGFRDGDRSFARGDVELADAETVHRPVADHGEPCICLAVTEGPLKFFNLISRIAQPFVRI